MKKSILLMISALSMISSAAKQNPWIKDLNFIYTSILENHPGIYNDKDPNFSDNLKKFYTIARSAIKEASINSNPKTIISNFTKSFKDTHLSVHWFDNTPSKKNTTLLKFSSSELSDEIAWVTVPTFDLHIEQKKDFNKLIEQLLVFQIKKYIVFDLRGNKGGNSAYGSQIIKALFGNEYAQQKKCLYNKNVFVDWRVSLGNLNHISYLLTKYPTNELLNIQNGLKKSLKKGDVFYREHSYETCESLKNITVKSLFNFKVIVIIDSFNVSAALNFIDELKIMTEKVILIGQKTKADRLYMEVRQLLLPSGSGNFYFPIKVYRNRPRLDNEPYVPNIEFQDVHNTQALQKFILEGIKRSAL